jgi:hypothetical protein
MSVRTAIMAGLALGVLYTLSPLTMLALPALAAVVWWAGRDLGPRERRALYWIAGTAIALRLLAIAVLFVTAQGDRPFAVFFGDEELFKSRPVWMRNIGIDVPVSPADYIYSYDDTGKSGYLFVLAAVQAFVGDAPYGVHVLNAAVYLSGVLLLFRIVRPALGRFAAMAGVAALLFVPSLFAWSISALKEPMYTFAAAIEILVVVRLVRSEQWRHKILLLAALIAMALVLESLRKGSMLVVVAGTIGGVLGGFIAPRPRLLLASALAAPVVLIVALSVAPVQARVMGVVRDSVRYHAGHVLTVGQSYHLVDELYYADWPRIFEIGPREATQYVARSVIHYVMEPLPWVERSRLMLAYLPEQALWWTMIALVPFGVAIGLKRDALLTSALVAHAVAIAMMVALTSGNIGTLIRHRGLVFPYLVWIAALGGGGLVANLYQRAQRGSAHGSR